jgi:hypothetical protein
VITTPSLLAENFPEVWRELMCSDAVEVEADIGEMRIL